MSTVPHEFVTVEMRGLKAALLARANSERTSVSTIVRRAVARELGGGPELAMQHLSADERVAPGGSMVKLSIRLTVTEARRLAAEARAAGLSRGAYLAGLMAGIPVLSTGAGRSEHIAALRASTSEMATLCRNIHRLAALLRQANVAQARPYWERLGSVADDVRQHLELASRVLADLQPRQGTSDAAAFANP